MISTHTWGGRRPGAGPPKNNKNRLIHGRRVTNPHCPRCAGRLYEDSDHDGRFLSCINCGYLVPLDHYDPTGRRQESRRRARRR